MSEKRFVYIEHKGADYILDTPNWELDFIEMLGDTLEAEEIVDLLNKLNDENEELKQDKTNLHRAMSRNRLTYLNEYKKLKHRNELLEEELKQCRAVIDNRWSEYLQKKELEMND